MGTIGDSATVIKYKAAVAALRTVGDPLKLAHAVRHLGDAYSHAGKATLAEPCYVEALSIYRVHGNRHPLDLANAVRSYAVLKDQAGAAEDARQLWQEAHDLYVSVHVPAGVAESGARLALLARQQGDLQRSREWLDRAITAAGQADDLETLRYVHEVKAQFGL